MIPDTRETISDVDPEALPLIRIAEFSYWLQESVCHRVQKEVSSLKDSSDLQHMFLLLTGRQLVGENSKKRSRETTPNNSGEGKSRTRSSPHPREVNGATKKEISIAVSSLHLLECKGPQTFCPAAYVEGGSRQVRFQPRFGNLLASSTGNVINIFDVETNNIQQKFEVRLSIPGQACFKFLLCCNTVSYQNGLLFFDISGHVSDVRSICWDMSGNFLASVSKDSARIWCVSRGKCLHELCSSGNKFQSCIFHLDRAQLLVIGSHEPSDADNGPFSPMGARRLCGDSNSSDDR